VLQQQLSGRVSSERMLFETRSNLIHQLQQQLGCRDEADECIVVVVDAVVGAAVADAGAVPVVVVTLVVGRVDQAEAFAVVAAAWRQLPESAVVVT